MSKLALASLCVSLLSCAAQQAEYYIDQLDDPRRQVRRDASHTLVQLGGMAVEPLLNRAATGSDSLRYIAAQILGQIGDQRATPFLKSLLRDDNRYVREQAVRALGQLDDPRLHPTLASVLADDSVPEVRGAAAWSLGNLRDTTAVPSLVHALADTIPSVRRQALAALQFLWTPAAEAAALDRAPRPRRQRALHRRAAIRTPPDPPRPRRAVSCLDRRQHLGPRRERPHPRPHRRHHSREAARAHVRRARRSRSRGRQRGIAPAHGPKLRGRPVTTPFASAFICVYLRIAARALSERP